MSFSQLWKARQAEIHRRILEEIQSIKQAQAQAKAAGQAIRLRLRMGQRVCFVDGGTNEFVRGVVKRINKKSANLITDCGRNWTVDLSLLQDDFVESRIVEPVIDRPLLPKPSN